MSIKEAVKQTSAELQDLSYTPATKTPIEIDEEDSDMHPASHGETSTPRPAFASTSTNQSANQSNLSRPPSRPPSRYSSEEPPSPSQRHFSYPGRRYRPSISSMKPIGPSLIAISEVSAMLTLYNCVTKLL